MVGKWFCLTDALTALGWKRGDAMGSRDARTEVGSGGVQCEMHPNSESAQENEEATPDVPG